MIRAYCYLAMAGVVWIAEGILFSHFLKMASWQVALLTALYVGLFAVAARYFVRSLAETQRKGEFSAWRLVTLLPMVVVIVGSFASLPVVLFVVILGKL